MTTPLDVGAYLRRIDYRGPLAADVETLHGLQWAHLRSVPFENLDIPLGRPITLAVPALFDKIVTRRRGGFCYELNGLFAWLLGELGFGVHMLSGRVFSERTLGPEFDHMLLHVEVGTGAIADVGFGDSFTEPLLLGTHEQTQGRDVYRMDVVGDRWELHRRRDESDWQPQYQFSLRPRRLEEFAEMCRYQQTSPDSHFTRKSVCSLLTHDGRITLSNGRLIVTAGGERIERAVADVDEYRRLLDELFGMQFDAKTDLGALIETRE